MHCVVFLMKCRSRVEAFTDQLSVCIHRNKPLMIQTVLKFGVEMLMFK